MLDNNLESDALSYPLQTSKKIRLEALFKSATVRHLHETPIAQDQCLSELPDGWVKMQVTVVDTSELCWWLLGFDSQMEVRKP